MTRAIDPETREAVKAALGFQPDSERILTVARQFNIPVSYACAVSARKAAQ